MLAPGASWSPHRVVVPRWDVPRQNVLVRRMAEAGMCLVACNDLPLSGREFCFRPSGEKREGPGNSIGASPVSRASEPG